MTYRSSTLNVADFSRSRGDFIDDLNEAIRHNPVPAALIGAGLLWMFAAGARNTVLGGASRSMVSGLGSGAKQAGGAAYRGTREVSEAVAEGVRGVAETVGEVGSQAADAVRNAAGAVGSAASQAASAAATVAQSGADAAGSIISSSGGRDSGPGSGANFQHALANMFEKQPLLLGAVGVAVGAAIAAALPASVVENRVLGDAADSLKAKAEDLWTDASKRAETMAVKGLEEARAQGLTPEAAGQALRGVTEKVMGVVEAGKQSATSRIKG